MSHFLDTKHKRKSVVLTSIFMSLLLISIFFVGLTYLDPPLEYGIAVNFGTSNVGRGDVQPIEAPKKETIETNPSPVEQNETQKIVEEKQLEEEVLTQETEDAIAIAKKKEEQKKIEEEKQRIEKERLEALKKQQEEEEKKKKLDALIGGINNASEGTGNQGEGNDTESGDKGKVTGDINSNGYYGNGGNGGSGDYQLGNRTPLNRPKPDYICNEEGLVVVSIEVNTQGKVIKATAGVKGSTNTADCLLSQAKEAALKTTWQADANAPSKQIGTIKYRFSLSQ